MLQLFYQVSGIEQRHGQVAFVQGRAVVEFPSRFPEDLSSVHVITEATPVPASPAAAMTLKRASHN